MKKIFLVANWKSHKNIQEAHTFITRFLSSSFINWLHASQEEKALTKEIILCPPFHLLSELAKMITDIHVKVPVELGAQDISPFASGSHTGEVSASEVVGLVKYIIIGHSERRREFGETDELVARKVKEALRAGLEPIVCVQEESTPVPDGVRIIAYEPLSAIGSGKPDSPEDALRVASTFKSSGVPYVLYGGSVTSENVHKFTSLEGIDGVLVGGASLDPDSFAEIIKRA